MSTSIKPGTQVHVVKRDPFAKKLLGCAVAGKADVVIVSDKELLAIRHYRQVRIQTRARFLQAFFRTQSR